MPRARRIPAYRLHKATGQATVRLAGRDYYLGKFGCDESRRRYDDLIRDWLSKTDTSASADRKVSEVLFAFWRFAKEKYGRTGKGKYGNAAVFRGLLRLFRKHFGRRTVRDFGPKSAKRLLAEMVAAGWSRTQCNRQLSNLKLIFKWAASEELIPVDVYQRLTTVAGLRKGDTNARENEPVEPIDDATVERTLPELSAVTRAMVQFQRATGCRPAEVCAIRPCDVDRSGDVWVYEPEHHKTEHRGKARRIYIGPRGQDVLRPFLLRPEDEFCFNANQRKKSRDPRYVVDAYRRAIHRACDRAGVPRWSPNRLRHSVATIVRQEFGLEASQAVLGHSTLATTQIYAERTEARAIEVAKKIG